MSKSLFVLLLPGYEVAGIRDPLAALDYHNSNSRTRCWCHLSRAADAGASVDLCSVFGCRVLSLFLVLMCCVLFMFSMVCKGHVGLHLFYSLSGMFGVHGDLGQC